MLYIVQMIAFSIIKSVLNLFYRKQVGLVVQDTKHIAGACDIIVYWLEIDLCMCIHKHFSLLVISILFPVCYSLDLILYCFGVGGIISTHHW